MCRLGLGKHPAAVILSLSRALVVIYPHVAVVIYPHVAVVIYPHVAVVIYPHVAVVIYPHVNMTANCCSRRGSSGAGMTWRYRRITASILSL